MKFDNISIYNSESLRSKLMEKLIRRGIMIGKKLVIELSSDKYNQLIKESEDHCKQMSCIYEKIETKKDTFMGCKVKEVEGDNVIKIKEVED